MTERTYPRKQWVLHPRTKLPMKVKILAKRYPYFSGDWGDTDSRGNSYSANQMFNSKTVAIRRARSVAVKRQKALDAGQAALKDYVEGINKVEAADD